MTARQSTQNGKGNRPAPASRRAIGYLRVSTAIQAERGMGLDVQRDKVADYATEHDLELVDVVREAASGGLQAGEEFSWEHRPVLLQLMERAERGEYDILLVARFDRLSRDYATLIVLERRFRRHGVEIVSVAEEHNGDGPIGEFIRGQLALAAQLERAMIRDRLSAGKARARQAGRHASGSHPYGYTTQRRSYLEPDTKRLEGLAWSPAEVVRQMFTMTRDWTPGRIARELNHLGYPASRGGAWTQQAVRVILTNPVYTGQNHDVKNAHPAIVSRRLFNTVQAVLAARARNT